MEKSGIDDLFKSSTILERNTGLFSPSNLKMSITVVVEDIFQQLGE